MSSFLQVSLVLSPSSSGWERPRSFRRHGVAPEVAPEVQLLHLFQSFHPDLAQGHQVIKNIAIEFVASDAVAFSVGVNNVAAAAVSPVATAFAAEVQ